MTCPMSLSRARRWKRQSGPGIPERGWSVVPFADHYEAHRSGLVRNRHSGHVLAPRVIPGRNYCRVSMTMNGIPDEYIHTVMLKTFVGDRPTPEHHASHIDGDPSNNALRNLCWETPAENNARKADHGTVMYGVRNPMGRKTHCKRGHAFTDQNTRRANGKRICRTCARDHMRRRRQST